MGSGRIKKKKKAEDKMSRRSTNEIMTGLDVSSEGIVRLKVTVRKGARIESVPLKKLEKLAEKKNRYWKFEKFDNKDGWLTLIGVS